MIFSYSLIKTTYHLHLLTHTKKTLTEISILAPVRVWPITVLNPRVVHERASAILNVRSSPITQHELATKRRVLVTAGIAMLAEIHTQSGSAELVRIFCPAIHARGRWLRSFRFIKTKTQKNKLGEVIVLQSTLQCIINVYFFSFYCIWLWVLTLLCTNQIPFNYQASFQKSPFHRCKFQL